jgi:hypothetical protein
LVDFAPTKSKSDLKITAKSINILPMTAILLLAPSMAALISGQRPQTIDQQGIVLSD